MSYAQAYRSGSLGEAACPAGQVQSCPLQRPGAPSTLYACTCITPRPPPTTTAVMTQTATSHWGLIAAGVVSALVIWKFVL